MVDDSPTGDLPRDELLAEVEALRRRVKELEKAQQDFEVILEITTEIADDISEQLKQEREDLEVILYVITEHDDFVDEELLTRAEKLEAQSRVVREKFGRYL